MAAVSDAAVLFLRIQGDARLRGMGDVSVAMPDNPTAFLLNPACLGGFDKVGIQLSRGQWLPELAPDLYLADLGIGYAFEKEGVIALSFRRLSYGRIATTGETSSEITGTIEPYDLAIALSYQLDLTSQLSVGASGKFILSKLSVVGASTEVGVGTGTSFAFDFGILLQGVASDLTIQSPMPPQGEDVFSYLMSPVKRHSKGLAFGLCVQNLGPNISYISAAQSDALPRNLAVGLSYLVVYTEAIDLTVALEGNRSLVRLDDAFFPELIYNGGVELGIFHMAAVRFGFINDREGQIKTATWGLGLGSERVRFNMSFIPKDEDLPLSKTIFGTLSLNF
jgi:hypothetical protein